MTVEIPALGRPGFSLGCLYDLTTHQVSPIKLWDEEELKDDKLTTQTANSSHFEIETSNTQDQRCKALDVGADIKLDISGGAVVVEGSAKYVNSSNSNSQVSSVTYTSKKVTMTKSLNMEHLTSEKVKHTGILDQAKNATHVVSSITYGKNAHFRFESKVTDEKEKDKIAGRMKIAINSIKADGEGSINRNSKDDKFAEEIECDFFGDYSGITPPFNIEQAKKTNLEIEAADKDADSRSALGVP